MPEADQFPTAGEQPLQIALAKDEDRTDSHQRAVGYVHRDAIGIEPAGGETAMAIAVRVEKELSARLQDPLHFRDCFPGRTKTRTRQGGPVDDEVKDILFERESDVISDAQVPGQPVIGKPFPGVLDGARAAVHSRHAEALAGREPKIIPGPTADLQYFRFRAGLGARLIAVNK